MALVDPKFWQDKRVLVTGHTGFKGSWLTFWLSHMGAKVTGFALAPNTNPSLFSEIKLENKVHSIIGDIRNHQLVFEVVQSAQPEIIFHMAAQALVLEGYENPRQTYEINVLGTMNLLEAARKTSGIKTIINITTDKVYENKEWDWGYREIDPLGGHDPYSSSKACSELLTSSLRRSFFDSEEVSLITCRAGNVFGGGDWNKNRIVPDAIRAFSQNQPLKVRNPNSIRPWQHVLEPLRAYLLLAEKSFAFDKTFPKTWNIGPHDDDAIPVGHLAQILCDSWGSNARWEVLNQSDIKHEAKYLKLDCSLARNELDWVPVIDLKTGIKMTTEWHQSSDVVGVMKQQIHSLMG